MEKNKDILLLKTLLLSTSKINAMKHSDDKKLKSRLVGEMVGIGVVFLLLLVFGVLVTIGFGAVGIEETIPTMCAGTIAILSFILTLIKTNGYLFGFKEYDMLLAMPFSEMTVVSDKFLYMYIQSLPWYALFSVAMMVGYGIFAKPAWYIYMFWIVLSAFLPIIPMVIASALGALIVRIGSGFRHKKIVQTILIFIIVIPCFFLRFFFEKMFRDDQVEEMMNAMAGGVQSIEKWYFPAKWMRETIVEGRISSFLLFLGVSILIFELFFYIVSKSYRKINSNVRNGVAHKKAKKNEIKKKSMIKSIAFKEFKSFTGSTAYLTNVGMGAVLISLLGIVSLFVSFEKLMAEMMQGAPIETAILFPAIPFICYFMIGMVPTTCISPSLEGKNYWIVQSLPIDKKDLYKGKMLFNMYLFVPFTLFGIICLCISAKTGFVTAVLCCLLGLAQCIFSTTFGCFCGVKHINTTWENEIEVIKQGNAIVLYLIPNMFSTMIFLVGVVFLGILLPTVVVYLFFTFLYLGLGILFYFATFRVPKKRR